MNRADGIIILVAGAFGVLLGVWTTNAAYDRASPCQIAIGDKSAFWPRGRDKLCHIEDLQAANAAKKP